MTPEAERIAADYWHDIQKEPRDAAQLNPIGFMALMAQMQIDLILCHLDGMDTECATRAQLTLRELELKL